MGVFVYMVTIFDLFKYEKTEANKRIKLSERIKNELNSIELYRFVAALYKPVSLCNYWKVNDL